MKLFADWVADYAKFVLLIHESRLLHVENNYAMFI